jgi:phosphoserine phosphatase RsbU/P
MVADEPEPEVLRCMEIWGGCDAVSRVVRLPGVDLWVLSRPHEGADCGGDIHYVSLCGGGLVTRAVVADVSGHGERVAQSARALRDLVRRNINRKSQDRLVGELNRQFADLSSGRRFATAIVATYLADKDRLTIHNAGHPHPIWYRANLGRWELMTASAFSNMPSTQPPTAPADLPFGLDPETPYHSAEVVLARGDVVVFYTDALTEATGPDGHLLGEQGLLTLAATLPLTDPGRLGAELLAAVETHQGETLHDDDLTMLVLQHHAGPRRRPGLLEKMEIYGKVFGFRPV